MDNYQIGDLVVGTVSGVKPYAIFFVFENGSKGLLHISEIADGYIRDIECYGRMGDQIKVKIIDIDPNNGFLRVSLKKVPESERYSTHSNDIKSPIVKDEEGFKTLKEHLDKWIQETLEMEKKENGEN